MGGPVEPPLPVFSTNCYIYVVVVVVVTFTRTKMRTSISSTSDMHGAIAAVNTAAFTVEK